MLVNVVDNALMEGAYKMKQYSVKPLKPAQPSSWRKAKTYAEGEFIHTFFGYARPTTPSF